MAEELPSTDPDMVHQLQTEYDQAFISGSQQSVDEARFRLVWASVHSSDLKHVHRGLALARARLESALVTVADKRDLQYLAAVGEYRLGQYVESRRLLRQVLQGSPGSRQAQHLLDKVDDIVLKEGVIGISIGAAVVGVGLAVLFGVVGGRK
mmetsp:Transcript_5554/g.9693  ORF Transcript_5554/g.9693 Transcript_5554/m.9693 type:complete len:152 (-) Transcript_5554:386-841(-)|eukprot:CAMPEP_0119104042 /NCGR_PEP_ID=MMETSP1180-20130426/2364_1 /TAXON_ID=3052 ORGANISM="Chlamydomonas cf sp, Strain CCMP681" /NCGR_SAMPLE_ID=MMETSP1180 /ASSEMBLY_ACC=CAM_ASM_000741 /LENGTH=151 /DNA_ID=CAMNT_0007088709 /DNA_START=154 /DNA_END=609 /DNA_ORIENTATION=-